MKNTDITVLDRRSAQYTANNGFKQPTLIITIRDIGSNQIDFSRTVNAVNVVSLEFDDVLGNDGINEQQAKEIASAVNKIKEYTYIQVNCECGVSCSAGVAAAILLAKTGNDDYILDNGDYAINERCYKYVWEAITGKEMPTTTAHAAGMKSKFAYMNAWPLF